MVEFNATRADDPDTYVRGFGGDTSNMAIAAARLGARAGYVSRVGDDAFGRSLLRLWADEGVDTRGVTTDPAAPTGVYFVTHGPAGHEFSYLRAGSAASRMEPATLPVDVIRGARVLHVSGISQAISAKRMRCRVRGHRRGDGGGSARFVRSESAAEAVVVAAGARGDSRDGGAVRLVSAEPRRRAGALRDHRPARDRRLVPRHRRAHRRPQVRRRWRVRFGRPPRGAHRRSCGRNAWMRPAPATASTGPSPRGRSRATILFSAARYANAAAALATTGFGAVAPLPRDAEVRALLERAA